MEAIGLGDKPCCSRSGLMVEDVDAGKGEGSTDSERVKTLEGTRPLL